MAKDYDSFCTSPQDPIATIPSGPKYSTAPGQYDGDPNYPGRDKSDVGPSEKTYDKAIVPTPTDETRGFNSK